MLLPSNGSESTTRHRWRWRQRWQKYTEKSFVPLSCVCYCDRCRLWAFLRAKNRLARLCTGAEVAIFHDTARMMWKYVQIICVGSSKSAFAINNGPFVYVSAAENSIEFARAEWWFAMRKSNRFIQNLTRVDFERKSKTCNDVLIDKYLRSFRSSAQ